MMIMTAKLNLKKIVLILAGVAAVVLSLILVLGGDDTAASAEPAVTDNDARVKFLKDFGWDAVNSPKESGQVRIPEQTSEVYERYNMLQKSQGYDLSQYAGKKVLRYVYEIRNFPNAKGPVYATLLVCKNRIIGGDVTDSGAGGKIQGFRRAPETAQESQAAVPENHIINSEP